MSGDPSGSPRAVDWTPSKAQWAWINLVGVALTVLGFVGHFAAWALSRSASGGRFGLTDVVMVIVVTVVLIVAHELGHGLALLTLGHRPTFGVARVGRVVVGLTTTAPGVRMSRRAFDYVALAALVLLTSATLSWAAYGPMGGAAVVPGAIHLGVCVGDLALVARASRIPRGSLIEDRQTGIRIHPPENTAARGHRD
ncbi:MAG: DUF3267 domain-containing protein [Cutibacterium avidum]|nr:DUF3267 domain-containing protein [Cutibacterium avidum]